MKNRTYVPTPEVEFSQSKLCLHPDRLHGCLVDDLTIPPISIEVSLTSRCGLSCKWCSDLEWRKRHAGDLQVDALLNTLREFKEMGLKGVVLEGGGEPTLHNEFDKVVEGISGAGLALGLITNGTKTIPTSLVKKFEWIRISLDSSTPEEYQNAKGVPSFFNVLNTINTYSMNKGKCVIGIGYLISTITNKDVLGVARQCQDSGVDYFQIRGLDNSPDIDVPADYDLSEVEALSDEYFKVYAHQVKWEADDTGNYGLPCRAHALSTVIGSDGKVFFCCRLHANHLDDGTSMGIIGDIYTQTAQEIWLGKKRKDLACKVRSPEFTKKFCPSCRHSKFNLMIEELRKVRTKNFI